MKLSKVNCTRPDLLLQVNMQHHFVELCLEDFLVNTYTTATQNLIHTHIKWKHNWCADIGNTLNRL